MEGIYSVKINHNEQIENIFRLYSHHDEVVAKGLVSQDEIVEDAILFVGINPSSTNSKVFCQSTNYYNLLQRNNDYRKYFRRFEEISEKTSTPWTHMDLFYFQETNQKHVNFYLNHSDQSRDFLKMQLEISKQILEGIKPKVIVISNALARDFFGTNMPVNLGYTFEFDLDLGTHMITSKNSNLFGVPVFFTSMLTGVRALDNGSFERLIWHINKILTHNSKQAQAANVRTC